MVEFNAYTEKPHKERHDWANLRDLLPLLWRWRGRVGLALACLLLAKLATVGVPLLLKALVDHLTPRDNLPLVLPTVLLLGYGALRLAGSLFNELRDALFARVRYGVMRELSEQVLAHLHQLPLRFHLERQTGAISRDLERGTRSLSTLMNYLVFNVLPILAEFLLVAAVLLGQYPPIFMLVTFITVLVYFVFTFAVTDWRMNFRLEMNKLDSQANTQAFDSLVNYETVKYFTNENMELRRYHDTLRRWEDLAVLSQTSMSVLNFGQGAIIALGVTLIMFLAAEGVTTGQLTLGDLVLMNAFLLQLFIPLNFLGIVYRQIRYALADMDLVVRLLRQPAELQDVPQARPLTLHGGRVEFRQVSFAYHPERPILHDLSFCIAPGQKVAVVGPSGAGKSTLARLLVRFYAPQAGQILIDAQDISQVSQTSLRAAIGVVPQDTVLFNESLEYNLRYAKPDATEAEWVAAAQRAQLHDFIQSLPQRYQTVVGERGLKLSGGEKQRVAIARVMLKNPKILVFDEATSSLDSNTERQIQSTLQTAAMGHTTLVIAHRLSTIVDADQILVLQHGRIVERGTHGVLLAQNGLYAELWNLQQREEGLPPESE